MTDLPPLRLDRRADGVARITLDRPAARNAFDADLIARLTEALEDLAADASVRVVVLTGAGPAFSAGADLAWMRAGAALSRDANRADALRLAHLMRALDRLPKPTLALVNGPAIGGGLGLVAACDVAVASDRAVFAASEVRLGLVPAVIGPYVVAAIGARQARRLFLTAERVGAAEAKRIGLVHDVVPTTYLEPAGERVVSDLLKAGPAAAAEAKALVRRVAGASIDDALIVETAELIARLRASEEGKEGVAAFLERRPPAWSRG